MSKLIVLALLLLASCSSSTNPWCDDRGCWTPSMSASERDEVCKIIEAQKAERKIEKEQ